MLWESSEETVPSVFPEIFQEFNLDGNIIGITKLKNISWFSISSTYLFIKG